MARMDIPEALDKKIWCDPAELLSNVSSAVLNFSKPLWVESIESLWKLTQIVWMNRVFITGGWPRPLLWDLREGKLDWRLTGMKVGSVLNVSGCEWYHLEQLDWRWRLGIIKTILFFIALSKQASFLTREKICYSLYLYIKNHLTCIWSCKPTLTQQCFCQMVERQDPRSHSFEEHPYSCL